VSRRWGVTLAGHPFDLAAWAQCLPPGFDPSVEREVLAGQERFVLRSSLSR